MTDTVTNFEKSRVNIVLRTTQLVGFSLLNVLLCSGTFTSVALEPKASAPDQSCSCSERSQN